MIFDYLEDKWGKSVTDAFQVELNETIVRLARNPEIGIITETDMYSFPIRMYRIHYRFDANFLKVAFIQDMRSDKEMINIE